MLKALLHVDINLGTKFIGEILGIFMFKALLHRYKFSREVHWDIFWGFLMFKALLHRYKFRHEVLWDTLWWCFMFKALLRRYKFSREVHWGNPLVVFYV
jgi:hypothetical protein